ncbi:c-type cytochrome [Candidatus Foliamicus sp.]
MKRFACLMISAAAMAAAGNALAAGDPARGQAEFEVCAVCHGEQGEGFEKYGAPRIGGQEDWYIITSLNNFRAGLRAKDNCDVADVAGTFERAKATAADYAEIEAELASHFDGVLPAGGDCSQPSPDVYGPLMRAVALTLADDQAVEDLAAYATSLTPPNPPATVEGDVAAGTIGYATCIACHGVQGEGNQALNAPGVAGQHDWYTVRQMEHYIAGIRGTDPRNIFDTQMRPMAMVLPTPEAIRNVAAYINTFTAGE